MTARRLLKAAEAIREVVGTAVLTEIRDPRVKNVTITFVEVAPDMRSAKIHISVMGDEGREKLCLRGLEHAAGFLQHKIAERIDTRYTPRLSFVIDKGVKNSLEIDRILREVLPKTPVVEPGLAPDIAPSEIARANAAHDDVDANAVEDFDSEDFDSEDAGGDDFDGEPPRQSTTEED